MQQLVSSSRCPSEKKDDPALYTKIQEQNLLRQCDLLSNCIEIGLKKDIEAFDKYALIRRNAEMILKRSGFSSGFHKEGISSTVFAQAWAVFSLRAAGFWLRVGAAKT